MVRLHRYIEENFRTATLKEAAELLGYDIYHLSRQIRQKTGRTFLDIVQEKRMLQAAFLLNNTALPVGEVSLAVGYENISYFHRIFFAAFGRSPKHYRDEV
jgi:AraC-like DNA-binding protein